nr:hypothetical protein [Mimivirus sp.]
MASESKKMKIDNKELFPGMDDNKELFLGMDDKELFLGMDDDEEYIPYDKLFSALYKVIVLYKKELIIFELEQQLLMEQNLKNHILNDAVKFKENVFYSKKN